LILPEYTPTGQGSTDFLHDHHMQMVHRYVNFLAGLDGAVGTDIRNKVEAYSYQAFGQRVTKRLRADSSNYGANEAAEF
jgi:hypothetical protein